MTLHLVRLIVVFNLACSRISYVYVERSGCLCSIQNLGLVVAGQDQSRHLARLDGLPKHQPSLSHRLLQLLVRSLDFELPVLHRWLRDLRFFHARQHHFGAIPRQLRHDCGDAADVRGRWGVLDFDTAGSDGGGVSAGAVGAVALWGSRASEEQVCC